MEKLTLKIAYKFARADLIDEKQVEWFAYWLRCRIIKVGGFVILFCAGTLLFPFMQVLLLNLGFVFLREKAGGMHMPTRWSCLVLSLICEYGCLFAIRKLQACTLTFWAGILFLTTILISRLAPCNSVAAHLSNEELKTIRKAVEKRLCLYILVSFVLLLEVPSAAITLIIAEIAVALLVVLVRFGVGT